MGRRKGREERGKRRRRGNPAKGHTGEGSPLLAALFDSVAFRGRVFGVTYLNPPEARTAYITSFYSFITFYVAESDEPLAIRTIIVDLESNEVKRRPFGRSRQEERPPAMLTSIHFHYLQFKFTFPTSLTTSPVSIQYDDEQDDETGILTEYMREIETENPRERVEEKVNGPTSNRRSLTLSECVWFEGDVIFQNT